RVPLVAQVPDNREQPARPEGARELGQRPVVVEPVERLRGRYAVDGRVAEWERLGQPLEDMCAGNRELELLAHLAHGLHRNDPRAARDEQPRELARPRGQIADDAPGPES